MGMRFASAIDALHVFLAIDDSYSHSARLDRRQDNISHYPVSDRIGNSCNDENDRNSNPVRASGSPC